MNTIKHDMSHVCKKKYDYEHTPIDENQIVLSDVSSENSDFNAQEIKNG